MMGFILIMAFIQTVYVLQSHAKYTHCTELLKNCKCKSQLVVCRNVTYIPKMPVYIKEVIIEHSYLQKLTKETFRNLQTLNLTFLYLRTNNIRDVSVDAFSNLHNLRHLRFRRERELLPAVMRDLLFGVTRKLERLDIQNFNWTTRLSGIPDDIFAGLRNSSIRNVSLVCNNISTFKGSWFDSVDTLHSLDLSENYLRVNTTWFSGMDSLQILNLALNSYKNFPDFCKNRLPNLRELNLESNKITDFVNLNKRLQCLDKLEELNINGHAIRIIYGNTFSSLRSLKTLRISELSQIRHISGNAFKSNSLQSIFFYDNGFKFSKYSVDISKAFANVPNLRNLDISRNYLRMKTADFQQMLKPLTNLTDLTMHELELYYLPFNFTELLPSLQNLNLSKNEFSKLSGRQIFGDNSPLKRLSLSQNRISIFNQNTLPESLLNNLKFLNLSRNPLSCTCQDVKWFFDWLQNPRNRKKVVSLDITLCESPDNLKGKALFTLTVRDICPLSEEIKHLIIGVSVSVLIILFVVGIIYRSRWHIRHWLFIVRSSRRPGYTRLPGDDFVYDGFLVYAEEDRDFVHNTLLPRVENQEGYKLCVHFRDFDVGKFIADNIVENMNKSRKVVVILSNSFAKSRWCDFELMIAQRRLLSEKRDILVLILYKDIDFRHMSSNLRMLLTTMTYAKWTTDKAGEDVFWEQILHGLRQPENVRSIDEYKAYHSGNGIQ